MDDPRICGTALRQIQAIGSAEQLRKGLRALARGDRAGAAALVPARFQRGPGSAVCVEAAAHLHAMFAQEAGTGSDTESEATRQALVARANDLDAQIARPVSGDAVMWRARAMVERSQAALALGDPELAATLAREAIESLAGLWGPDHLEVGSYWDDFATALFALGRTAEADAAVARARAIKERHGSPYRGLD